jgi:ParB family transcriptional regulator, chromosome partitioning protein
MNTQTVERIPLSRLSIDKSNVRTVGRGTAEATFVASIEAHGIIEPLIVRKNGKGYLVINGGKRCASLAFMGNAGMMAKGVPVTPDYMVPVVIREDDDNQARDVSLVTNIVRSGMHPADEAVAFAQLRANGKTVAEIAVQYGIDERRVRQRLALGELAPIVLDEWRAGHLNYETVKAFTLTDAKGQEKLFKKFSKDGDGRIDAWDVRDALDKNGESDAGRFVAFVGIDAYVKRGGKVTEDLFGTDHVVSNEKLATVMANEKLEAECKRLVAEGWSFALVKGTVRNNYDYGKVNVIGKPTDAEAARLDELRKIMDADGEGEEAARAEFAALEDAVELRSYTPEQKARSGCFVSIDGDGRLEVEYGKVSPAEKKAAAAADKAERGKAGKTATSRKAATVSRLSTALQDRLTIQRTKAIKMALVDEAAAQKSPLTKIACTMISAQITPERRGYMPSDMEKRIDDLVAAITPKILNARMVKHFDAADYFAGAPKTFMLKAITEAVNADEARKIGSKKKAEIAAFATANVPKTRWLPVELRTCHYDGPAENKKSQRR